MHFLSVVAIFKDEAHCLKEWLDHYLNEGVDHFYLIDNGSTDNSEKILSNYLQKNQVTLVKDETRWAQVALYNKYFLKERKNNRWFIVCDMDEFIYSRRGFKTIRRFLKFLPPPIGLVRIPWKMFGSSGLEKQPDQIIPNFTKRSNYNGVKNQGMKDEQYGLGKVIVRSSCLKWFDIHHCDTKKFCLSITSDLKMYFTNDKDFQKINEDILRKSFLHLNHYPIQSKEWFLNVKAKRGSADSKDSENIRDIEYFEIYDQKSNELSDVELAEKS
ncbi:glycosyltransferase family 2 protein [Ekhidna sp.]|uniref:glycosyltransferase family 2 protein n=1 Tax=Ekhidna sp. TaxID=2608089 RepID=UPI003B50316C